jgi:hypothetical protein
MHKTICTLNLYEEMAVVCIIWSELDSGYWILDDVFCLLYYSRAGSLHKI